MPSTQYTNLDFADIRNSLKDFLRASGTFTDYDFEGSNLSIILDLLAYNTTTTAYNANMIANEAFLDSATLRENVVALARNIGHVPQSRQSAKAKTSLTVRPTSSDVATVTLKAGLVATGGFRDTNFLFSIPQDVTATVDNIGNAEFELDLYEGTYLTKTFVVDTSLPNQRYIIPNPYVDTSTISVRVKDNATSTTSLLYSQLNNIVGVTSTTEYYLIQETSDEKYEVLFGDGVFGKKLQNGNVVEVSYIVTNGKSGNGVRTFSFSGNVVDNNGATILSGIGDFITLNASSNGSEVESIDTIKNIAPRIYASQYRAVTANDFEAIIPTIYRNAQSVSAYGGEDATPPQFGKVFISIKPKEGRFVSDFDKRQIKEKLKSYTVAGIQPEIIDLKFLYVELESSIYYSSSKVLDIDTLRTKVISNLTTYSDSDDINKFGGRFKYSKALSLIDDTDSAITSNITKVKIRRDLEVVTENPTQYELCFGNQFHSRRKGFSIKSTGFNVENIRGTLYFADRWKSATRGDLIVFRLDETGNPEIVIPNAGVVKYDVGEILIDTIRITSTVLDDDIVQIQAIPESNDVLGLKDLFVQLSIGTSSFSMIEDLIASGSNTSGTRFASTSSFINGKYIRQ